MDSRFSLGWRLIDVEAAFAAAQSGDKVTLLAFMGDEWAYVQIGLEGRVCRLFIPRSALSQN